MMNKENLYPTKAQWLVMAIAAIVTALICILSGCERNGVLFQTKPVGVHRVVVRESVKPEKAQ